MAYRSTAARSAHNQAVEQLVELFAADGLELDPGAIPVETPPPGCVLARDTALERSAAVYLLGGGLVHSERGGVYSYSGSKGAALFLRTVILRRPEPWRLLRERNSVRDSSGTSTMRISPPIGRRR